MPLPEQPFRPRPLLFDPRRIPAQRRAQRFRSLHQAGLRHPPAHRQQCASQQQVVQMHDRLLLRNPDDFAATVARQVFQRFVLFRRQEGGHVFRQRAVAVQQFRQTRGRQSRVRANPRQPCGSRRFIPRPFAPTADGQFMRGEAPLPPQTAQRLVRRLLAKGAEGRPLAADQRQHREVEPRLPCLDRADTVIATDLTGRRRGAVRQGPDAAVLKDDVLAARRQVREHCAKRPQQVVGLFLADGHGVGIVGRDIGRAQQDPLLQREEQYDASIRRLEKDLVARAGSVQFFMRQHQVRALRAADPARWSAQTPVDPVNPRAAGVDHQARPDFQFLALLLVPQGHRRPLPCLRRHIVERKGLLMRRHAIADELNAQALGAGQPGVVPGRRTQDVGVQRRSPTQRLRPTVEAMGRQGAPLAREPIVDQQADAHDKRSARRWPPRQTQKVQRRVEQAGKAPKQGHGRGQRFHVMRRIAQQTVALQQRLAHQTKLAILQIAQTTMHHVRGRSAGAGAEIALVHQQHAQALQRQFAKDGDAVRARPDDQDVDVRPFPQGLQRRSPLHDCLWPALTLDPSPSGRGT